MDLPDIKHVTFPRSIASHFGKRTPGHRYYDRYGEIDDYRSWVHALAEHVGLVLSSGEAATYLGITRISIWRWVNQGKLSSFNFSLCEKIGDKNLRIRSLDACIPLSELRQWHELRLARKADIERMEQEAEAAVKGRLYDDGRSAGPPSTKVLKRDKKLRELEEQIKREQIAAEKKMPHKEKTK